MTASAPMTERVERLARLLDEHRLVNAPADSSGLRLAACAMCGVLDVPHRDHLASVLAGEFEQTAARCADELRAWRQSNTTNYHTSQGLLALERKWRGGPCLRCGGVNGEHGLVHVRHGNGGGHNEPCPRAALDGDTGDGA